MRPIKFLTPHGNRVLVAIPLATASAVACYLAMWAVPDLAFLYMIMGLTAPFCVYTSITGDN